MTFPSRRLLAGPIATAALLAGCGGAQHAATSTTAPKQATSRGARALATPVRLVATRIGALPASAQNVAVAALGGRSVLLGGLNAADSSRNDIQVLAGARLLRSGTLPNAQHDAAAVALGGAAYLFGGGDLGTTSDRVVRVDPGDGRATVAGRLSGPLSDVAAAAIGDTAYIVGGYTGTVPVDTVLAWRPGAATRTIAHLPAPVRYATVAAADGKLVIVGGSTPGGASRDVFVLDPASGQLRRLARLPRPLTHAAAATLGGLVYVLGGRGDAVGTPTADVWAIDPQTGRVQRAGSLPQPLSDLAAVTIGNAIDVYGGRSSSAAQAAILRLSPVPTALASISSTPTNAPVDVYAHDRAGMLSPVVRNDPARIYVPNSGSNSVDVIDPQTYRVVAHFSVGQLPQHVTPSYDLRTLWVSNDRGNSLTPIDPATAKPGKPVSVADPYNLYFTPDGRYAIVVAEALHRLDFRDPQTMALRHTLAVPCSGVDHMDFSADGHTLVASCEFSHELVVVDVPGQRVKGTIKLPAGGMPQDVKLSPDGRVFYVADMMANGVHLVDAQSMRLAGFIATGQGAHGLYASRDERFLYVSNRGEGSISLISFADRRVVAKWRLPGGGSPDMGGVSADGRVLWLSGRYNAEVYAIDTTDGHLLARIKVGSGPHGLSVFPQPGRYSLGHTGVFR
jgi:YVTN family beta-propeller protein